ncbi:hypothetical protein ACHAPT_012970 [Fusarium lateritium]
MSTKEQDEDWPNSELEYLKGSLTSLLRALNPPKQRRLRSKNQQGMNKDEAIEAVRDDLRLVAQSPLNRDSPSTVHMHPGPAVCAFRQALETMKNRKVTEEEKKSLSQLFEAFIRERDPQGPFLSFLKEGKEEGNDKLLYDHSCCHIFAGKVFLDNANPPGANSSRSTGNLTATHSNHAIGGKSGDPLADEYEDHVEDEDDVEASGPDDGNEDWVSQGSHSPRSE